MKLGDIIDSSTDPTIFVYTKYTYANEFEFFCIGYEFVMDIGHHSDDRDPRNFGPYGYEGDGSNYETW